MPGIFPVPTTRTSEMLTQTRLLKQLQLNQAEMLKLQTQLSTGRRLTTPSEDPTAAGRAIELQRFLEQKEQAKVNLTTSQSYLTASETAAASVSNLLADMRGLAVSLADNTISESQRDAASEEIRRALDQLVDIGNTKFRGRYLFAGSKTTQRPFESLEEQVVFHGNDGELPTYADVDLLQNSNVSGADLFGAVSPERRGTVDLNPVLTAETKLSDLYGGRGIQDGSIVVSDGDNASTIDLSSAQTVGDVVKLIERNPPAGRDVAVRIGPRGLSMQLDAAGGGSLSVHEVGGGVTAAELGLREPTGVGLSELQGKDLHPRLTLGSKLSDVLGVRASTVLKSDGANNDIIVEAKARGPEFNGVHVQLVDDDLLAAASGLVAGTEKASYSETAVASRAAVTFSGLGNNLQLTAATPGAAMNNVRIELVDAGAVGDAATVNFDAANKRLTLGVDSGGATTVQTMIDAINAQGDFTAAYDDSEPGDGGLNPAAAISPADFGVMGDTGNSGGDAGTLFVRVDAGASTANQVVKAIQDDPAVGALFDARVDDKDAASAPSAGSGAVDASAAALAGGEGVEFDRSGLQVTTAGETHTIAFEDAETIEDLLNHINGSGAHLLAEINERGDGINIRSRLSGADFAIGENGGDTATQLGVRTFAAETPLNTLNHGIGVRQTEGTDFTIRRSDGAELEIDLAGANTIDDVLGLINNHPDNADPATAVTARLAVEGNGIELVEATPSAGGELTVLRNPASEAAWDLGLVAQGEEEAAAVDPGDGTQALQGADVNPAEVKGAFNTLLRLDAAVNEFDLVEIERAAGLLEEDLRRTSFVRAELGARMQSLDTLEQRLDDEQVQLKETLSVEIDVDIVEAISDLTASQSVLQASMQMMGRTWRLSLLDYL